MKKTRFLLSSLALVCGLFIVMVSLISTNQVISFEGPQGSQRKFYLGETILPDHMVYPVVAAADNLLLIFTSAEQKIELKKAYSQIRMEYAQALLAKDELALANNALTKSQKYINQAALEVLANEDNTALTQEIQTQLGDNIEQAQDIIQQLPACQRSLAEQLNQSNQALLAQF